MRSGDSAINPLKMCRESLRNENLHRCSVPVWGFDSGDSVGVFGMRWVRKILGDVIASANIQQ